MMQKNRGSFSEYPGSPQCHRRDSTLASPSSSQRTSPQAPTALTSQHARFSTRARELRSEVQIHHFNHNPRVFSTVYRGNPRDL